MVGGERALMATTVGGRGMEGGGGSRGRGECVETLRTFFFFSLLA